MPFHMICQDITTVACDAIVNPTDEIYSGNGGTDYAIHTAAGMELAESCRQLPALKTGELAVTAGYQLPSHYIFHTVGPKWQGGTKGEALLLGDCYGKALRKAGSMGLQSIAFPLISAGAFGFPKDQVLRIAVREISEYFITSDEELTVFLCIYDRNSYALDAESGLRRFLLRREAPPLMAQPVRPLGDVRNAICRAKKSAAAMNDDCLMEKSCEYAYPSVSLDKWIRHQDDSFAVMLLKLIDKKGMTDVQCYKKANISRKTFYKIKNDGDYRPSKPTVLAFAIALELSLEETEQLLKTVGFSLSHSNRFDLIIEFYICHAIYDIYEINAALYQYDQECLGC